MHHLALFVGHAPTAGLLAAPEAEGLGAGVWVLLGLVAAIIAFAVRAVSKAGERRLDPKALAEQRRLEAERKEREAAEEAATEARRASEERKRAAEEKKAKAGEKKAAPKVEKPKGPELLLPPDKPIGEGLQKTRDEGFIGRLGKLFQGKQVDAALLDQVEEVLLTADIGVRTAQKLLDGLRARASRKELADADAVWRYLREEAEAILAAVGDANSLVPRGPGLHTALIVGVNGAGKTTSIGTLAHRMIAQGHRVLLGAGDTFRAAAADQLGIWAQRVGAELVEGEDGSDPSSVLFDAVKKAQAGGFDIALLDTAGRLHTNQGLVKELEKCHRVIAKALEGAPHEVILVLDATTGQNAIQQAHVFGKALGVTSIALTKLDGTAKGGVILGIADELKLPISWVGIGERVQDLRPFDRQEFLDALFTR